jgi:hypothetical protein
MSLASNKKVYLNNVHEVYNSSRGGGTTLNNKPSQLFSLNSMPDTPMQQLLKLNASNKRHLSIDTEDNSMLMSPKRDKSVKTLPSLLIRETSPYKPMKIKQSYVKLPSINEK